MAHAGGGVVGVRATIASWTIATVEGSWARLDSNAGSDAIGWGIVEDERHPLLAGEWIEFDPPEGEAYAAR